MHRLSPSRSGHFTFARAWAHGAGYAGVTGITEPLRGRMHRAQCVDGSAPRAVILLAVIGSRGAGRLVTDAPRVRLLRIAARRDILLDCRFQRHPKSAIRNQLTPPRADVAGQTGSFRR